MSQRIKVVLGVLSVLLVCLGSASAQSRFSVPVDELHERLDAWREDEAADTEGATIQAATLTQELCVLPPTLAVGVTYDQYGPNVTNPAYSDWRFKVLE